MLSSCSRAFPPCPHARVPCGWPTGEPQGPAGRGYQLRGRTRTLRRQGGVALRGGLHRCGVPTRSPFRRAGPMAKPTQSDSEVHAHGWVYDFAPGAPAPRIDDRDRRPRGRAAIRHRRHVGVRRRAPGVPDQRGHRQWDDRLGAPGRHQRGGLWLWRIPGRSLGHVPDAGWRSERQLRATRWRIPGRALGCVPDAGWRSERRLRPTRWRIPGRALGSLTRRYDHLRRVPRERSLLRSNGDRPRRPSRNARQACAPTN